MTHSEKKVLSGLVLFTGLITLYIFLRIFYTGSTSKFFLIWNIFLAWIPLLALIPLTKKTRIGSSILLIVWFVFFPNTLYLITDLKHLNHSLPFLEYWLDLMILCLTAMIGLLLGVYSLYMGQKKMEVLFSKQLSYIVISALILLSGFGVYLGRFPRLNSWHLFTEPTDLWITIAQSVQTLHDKPAHIFFVGLFSFTIGVLYSIFLYIKK